MVELTYLTVFFASLRCECHPPRSLFHFILFTVFLTAVNRAENPRTDGVSSFMKMVGLLTCSAFLHVEDLGLHV